LSLSVTLFSFCIAIVGYMADDEVIEVTPKSIRLRKFILDPSARERAARSKAQRMRSAKAK
jgi:predicted membrane GTPase involved in stress response